MDSKTCTVCGLMHGIAAFQPKRKVRKDGSVYEYRHSRCNACRYKIQAAQDSDKAANFVPAGGLWPRPVEERGCDVALMGWRSAQPVAYLGPRL